MKSMTFATLGLAVMASAAFADPMNWLEGNDSRVGATSLNSATALDEAKLDTNLGATIWLSSSAINVTPSILLLGKDDVVLETRSVGLNTTAISMTFNAPLPFTSIKVSPTGLAGAGTMGYQIIQGKAAR